MDMPETSVGIRKFRERMRLNQVELAKKLSIVQGNITAWESGRGTPSFQISKKMLEMGITVEELFGVDYNAMHNLEVREASLASSGVEPKQTLKKLNDFEADLLREMLDTYAGFEDELESIKKWKEVYKLEREIERGDKTTDMTAKKQRLQELQEQIEDENPTSNRFYARKQIKSLEEELEQIEDMERHNSHEKPDIRRRILNFQKEMEEEMYSYVSRELRKLRQQESTKEKVRKWGLERQLKELQEEQIKQTYSTAERMVIKQRIEELEKELENLKKAKQQPAAGAG